MDTQTHPFTDTSMSFTDFLTLHGEGIAETTRKAYPPSVTTTQHLPPLVRAPIGKQGIAAAALAEAVKRDGWAFLVAAMGSGKTAISATASAKLEAKRTLILCPPHLVKKWCREVEITVPRARTRIIKSITDFEKVVAENHGDKPLYVALSREMAKLSHGWKVGVNIKYRLVKAVGALDEEAKYVLLCPSDQIEPCSAELKARGVEVTLIKGMSEYEAANREGQSMGASGSLGARAAHVVMLPKEGLEERETRRVLAFLHCPKCGTMQETEKEGVLKIEALERSRHKCVACREPLYQADCDGARRYALAHYIAEKHPGFFDLFLIDEMHQLKGRGSAQGIASGALARAIRQSIGMTGTLFGGYASSIFHLLLRFSKRIREDFTYHDEGRFIQEYGIVERVITQTRDESREGRNSKRMKSKTYAREKPGVSPLLLKYILSNTVFLSLNDVADALPNYDERVEIIPMDDEQRLCYQALQDELKEVLKALRRSGGSARLLGGYITALLNYPDAPYKGEKVYDPKTGECLASAPALEEAVRYPKERRLLERIKREKAAGRKVVIYVKGMERRNITDRLEEVLAPARVKVKVLRAAKVPADKREAWIEEQVRAGVDVILCNPKCVETGLDMLDYVTYLYYQTEYSVYTLRQASKRGYRIGQEDDIEVGHYAYEDSIQEQAIHLIAAKAKASLSLEGEMVENGLTDLAEDDDIMGELAKQIVEGTKTKGEVDMGGVALGETNLTEWPDVYPVEIVPRFPLVTGGGAAIGYADDEMKVRGKNGRDMVIPEGTGLLFPDLMGAA